MPGTLGAALVVPLLVVLSAGAATLEELDTQLRAIEAKVRNSGVSPAKVTTKILQPQMELVSPAQQSCTLGSEDMLSERAALAKLLETKQQEVSELGERVTEMRRRLLLEGCDDAEKGRLADLRQDITAVTVDSGKERADVLLDCVNQKIVNSEREKAAAIESGAGSYQILGFTKRLDSLNDFSIKMLDLSIEISSVADLRNRLELSSEQFDALCGETDL